MTSRAVLVAAVLAILVIGGAGALVYVLQRGAEAEQAAASAIIVGAGDIAGCESASDSETAALLTSIGGTVFTLGDNAYPDGTPEQFAECYAPTWGRERHRTRPSIGSHDFGAGDAAGYYGYFGDLAGTPGQGWYSYEAGPWHVVVLNSVCLDDPGFCAGQDQLAWLDRDLSENRRPCIAAYWHTPRYSSGSEHGNDPLVQPFWDRLVAAGADVILNGDDHHYERFAPMDAAGREDPAGVRQFIVGTGGAGVRPLGEVHPASEFQQTERHGVLRLTLRAADYEWAFLAAPDGAILDSGTAACR